MSIKRSANAVWNGGLKDGNGKLSTESGAVKHVNYSFAKRFGDEPGTNPEELIAAAHAGCFSMAFSGKLEGAGIKPESIETSALVTMVKEEVGWTIKSVHLDTVVRAPGADEAKFQQAAEDAKKGCPVSRLLSNIDVTMSAKLA